MGTSVDKPSTPLVLGDALHSTENPATVRIDYVKYDEPAAVRFQVKRSDGVEFTYLLTHDGDTVHLHFDGGVVGMFLKIEDPFGIQHKSFWELEL
jgi:hypothetical protein